MVFSPLRGRMKKNKSTLQKQVSSKVFIYIFLFLAILSFSSCLNNKQKSTHQAAPEEEDPSVKKMIVLSLSQINSINLQAIESDPTKPVDILVGSETDANNICQRIQAAKYTCRRLNADEASSALGSRNKWVILSPQAPLKLNLSELPTAAEATIVGVGVVSVAAIATALLYSRFKGKKEPTKLPVNESPTGQVQRPVEALPPIKPTPHIQTGAREPVLPAEISARPARPQIPEATARPVIPDTPIVLELMPPVPIRGPAGKQDLPVHVIGGSERFSIFHFKGASVLENRLGETAATARPVLFKETKSILGTLKEKKYDVIDVPGDGDCGLYALMVNFRLQNKDVISFKGREYNIARESSALIKDMREHLGIPVRDLSPAELQRVADELRMIPPLKFVFTAFGTKGNIIDNFPDGFRTIEGEAWVPGANKEVVIILTDKHYIVAAPKAI